MRHEPRPQDHTTTMKSSCLARHAARVHVHVHGSRSYKHHPYHLTDGKCSAQEPMQENIQKREGEGRVTASTGQTKSNSAPPRHAH